MKFGQRERNDHMVMNHILQPLWQQGWRGAGSVMLWAMGVDGVEGCREGNVMPSHSTPPGGVQTHWRGSPWCTRWVWCS